MNQSKDITKETLGTQLRSLPRVVWILAMGLFIHRFGTFVIPFLTFYLEPKGYSLLQIGSIFLSLSVGGIGSMALGGRLTDLIGRKNTMAIALFAGAGSMLLMWQADSLTTYLITGFLIGLTQGMYHPASNSMLADVVPPERRVTAYAIVRLGVNLGFACGMAAAGFLAENHFDWLFIGDAATSVVFGLIALLTLPHGLRTDVKSSRWKPAIKHMVSNRLFVGFFIANLLAVSAFFQWSSSVALLIKSLGYTEKAFGTLMGGSALLIAIFEIPLSQITRRLPAYRVIAFGFFLCGLGLWINLFAAGWMMIAFALLIFTIGEMISMPVSGAYVADLAAPDMRGRYSAAVGMTWILGQAVAPGLGLLLFKHCPEVLWWGMLVTGILSAAAMLLRRK